MSAKKTRYRVAIIGSGPAGWTAALYASRAELEPVVFEGPQPGGQLTITTEVENFPGFVHGIQGPELMDVFREQAKRFGTEVVQETVVEVDFSRRPFRLMLDSGASVSADAVIVSTGASAKLLGLESEKSLMGYGVSACATCDGFFFKGKEVVVGGGGDTAMEEATFLTKFSSKVTVVHRREEFRASRIMLDRARQNPKIAVALDSTVEEILGAKNAVTGVRLRNAKTGQTTDYPAQGVFVAIGHEPNTELFRGKARDERGRVPEGRKPFDPDLCRRGLRGRRLCDPTYRQAVSAAGKGARRRIDAERWLAHQGIH